MSPGLEIAETGAEASDLLAAIHAECFAAPWPAEAFAKLVPDPFRTCFLAHQHGQPVGMLLLQCAADEAEILTVGVRPAMRRKGAGRALLAHAMAFAVAGRATHMILEVAEGNEAALALYEGLGFARVGRRSGYYAEHGNGAWRDAHIMEKRLGCPCPGQPIVSAKPGGAD